MFHVLPYPYKLLALLELSSLLFILPFNTFAENSLSQEAIQALQTNVVSNAKKLKLWEKNEWINLIHYNKEYDNYISQVDDERFFYAAGGNKNPEAELIATLKALFIATDNSNQQTQCKFIARTGWLSEQLKIDKNHLPEVHCTEYIEWRQLTQADSVTMIFPAYHLNSPSSMFGHTLLRLDKSSDTQSEWLSFAVNFGANITSDDNSLIYAYRGLVGGYHGSFITEPYFKKIQEYNRIEHRDIWEYRLNLTADETERMIKHLWELKTINFDYYFFDENCSYRLLELLEVARPSVELIDEFIVTAIPVDTVRAIENANMIVGNRYRPAQATEIQYSLNQLHDIHRELVMKLSNDIKITETEEFKSLTEMEQKNIINLAYKYLRYQNTKSVRDPAIAKRSYLLLQKISLYSADISVDSEIPTPFPPEKGHGSKRMTFAPGKRLDNYYGEFGFKMSFHDLEDNEHGFLQGASINIGSLQIRAEENETIRLYRLDFVDIFSLSPRTDFFKPIAWRVYTGFERQFTKGVDQLGYHVTGGGGGNWKFLGDNQFYTLATGRLEINKQLDHTIEPGIGFITGLLLHFGTNTARLEVSGVHFTDNTYRLRTQYIHNFVINRNNSLKIYAKYEWQENNTEFSDINLGYQYYF